MTSGRRVRRALAAAVLGGALLAGACGAEERLDPLPGVRSTSSPAPVAAMPAADAEPSYPGAHSTARRATYPIGLRPAPAIIDPCEALDPVIVSGFLGNPVQREMTAWSTDGRRAECTFRAQAGATRPAMSVTLAVARGGPGALADFGDGAGVPVDEVQVELGDLALMHVHEVAGPSGAGQLVSLQAHLVDPGNPDDGIYVVIAIEPTHDSEGRWPRFGAEAGAAMTIADRVLAALRTAQPWQTP